MANPTVTFLVPCYRLAHFLPECVRSILAQSYGDFELLILDDCSPDNTLEVAGAFTDPRVKYIRNEVNLRHLQNFNKGISLSRGKYIWLISADDYLRCDHVLARYVDLFESDANVGYTICPGFGVRNGVETRLLGRYGAIGDHDRTIPGHTFFKRLVHSNFVLTPSGLARRECYEKCGLFDLKMPWAGDWYLWCLFALHYDIGYFAEPMVCYREEHEFSMTNELTRRHTDTCAVEEIDIVWRLKQDVDRLGHRNLVKSCLAGIASTYARTLAAERYRESSHYMDFDRFEESLCRHTVSERERAWVRARVYDGVGNECYWRKDNSAARRFYEQAVMTDPAMVSSHAKRLLLSMGKPGEIVRRGILSIG